MRGSGGYPEVDFRRGECTFCGECASACPEAVLKNDVQPPWRLRLRVEDRCLAKRQVICQACADICDQQAISFPPQLRNVATPKVNIEDCNGCGACVSACPEDALVLETTQAVSRSEGVASHV